MGRSCSSARVQVQSHVQALEPRRLLAATLPRFDHIVVVVEENKSYDQILGAGSIPQAVWSVVPPLQLVMAPYIRSLARHGTSLTNMDAEAHPSQPNYLALFSGSTQGITGDTPPAHQFTAPSLGGQLLSSGLSFAEYSEDLPSAGYLGTKSAEYARKHNPASDFTDVPASSNLPFSNFPSDFSKLPTVSIVVPNQLHDMHSASIGSADKWLKSKLGGYVKWAPQHNSLLIVTWDEGAGGTNHIATILYGAQVRHRTLGVASNHYRLLRTIESIYHLPALGRASNEGPLYGAFRTPAGTATTQSVPTVTPQSIFSDRAIESSLWRRLSGASEFQNV